MRFSLYLLFLRLLFTFICLGTIIPSVFAQSGIINFSTLGSIDYKEKITQLEKYIVPKKYADKSSQAWYDEILTDRNKSLLASFKDDKLIDDSLLLNKCNSIFKKIASANKNYPFDSIKLYINRSIVANAACYGEGTIMINLGLFLWTDNDDELALVIAHEIAHQLLKHSDSRIEKSITMFTSDEFKEELKNIKKADYGKFDRFRKLMKGLNIESGKHSTYKESEADSLGVVLIKNAGFNEMKAAFILLKLDKVDDLFTSDKLYKLKDFLQQTAVDLSSLIVKPKYNGLSSVTVTMNADKDLDSIKTHPDCIKRYEIIAGKSNAPSLNCCTALNNLYADYKEKSMLEIVRYAYENNSIGLCVHLCIFALHNNYSPAIYNHFLSLCFSKLYYKDKHLERFNVVNVYANSGTNLKELQDFLFQVSSADLEILAAYFLNNKSTANAEDIEFAKLMFNTQVKMKDTESAFAAYNKQFPKNKYQYLIQKK
jgi:predicted SprT family Zn-dependent metalloprotease